MQVTEADIAAIDEDEAIAWTNAVQEALELSADAHGGDVESLMDHTTEAGHAFLSTLDPVAMADPTTEAFGRAVEALAVAYMAEHPELRVVEADAEPEGEQVTESVETVAGRVVEAKGTAGDGGRVFRVQILRYGTSRNGNRYTEAVMRKAAHLYNGAKAYDHHRTDAELTSSTLTGLVGSYHNVAAESDGLYGDLHLLPSAVHTAEALDATLANQAKGMPPLVGISHDVRAEFRPHVMTGGRRVREAASITAVQSADVVADPSAGGKAVRAMEGVSPTQEESEVPVTKTDVLAAFRDASDDELAAVGLARTGTTESTIPGGERVVESTSERVTESGVFAKTSFIGRTMIRAKAEDASLDRRIVEAALPDRFTENDVDTWIASHKGALALYERAGLEPSHQVQVTRESVDKRIAALNAMFDGDFRDGYSSIRQAYIDFTGARPRAFDEDFNRVILRESFGPIGYSSARRVTESLDSTSWAQALGDSITRRMQAEYRTEPLSNWRKIVKIVPVQDFRTQRRVHLGGYGTLPTVNEGAPYQPLTSPGDEEATYAIAKRGGTEDVTLEMVANDDVRSFIRIPSKLGRAAARTVYEYVWAFLSGNATYTADSVALFHANHSNTDSSAALADSTLFTGWRKMVTQTAYGDSSEYLGIPPKYLVHPPHLAQTANYLCSSPVALPSSGNASDLPNFFRGLEPVMVTSLTDTNDWFLVADPDDIPTIEMGFYQGREEPEMFTQAENTVGSMFDSDRWTVKIRHIYNATIEDYRGFYRGQG